MEEMFQCESFSSTNLPAFCVLCEFPSIVLSVFFDLCEFTSIVLACLYFVLSVGAMFFWASRGIKGKNNKRAEENEKLAVKSEANSPGIFFCPPPASPPFKISKRSKQGQKLSK